MRSILVLKKEARLTIRQIKAVNLQKRQITRVLLTLYKAKYYRLTECNCLLHGAMTNMIDFIDRQVEVGKSEEEIYLSTIKEFGIDRLTKKEKQEEIKQILAARAPADAPKIEIQTESKDLGEVNQEQGEIYTDFILQNSGQSDLAIDKLSSSCGCTSAAVIYAEKEGPRFTMAGHGKENPTDWKVAITPGDSAVLRVYYDPSVRLYFQTIRLNLRNR
jgi:hypothetical protein